MDTEKFTKENSKSITIRIPNELYLKIEKLAKEADRDISKEIRFIIRKYIEIQEKD